MLKLLLAFALFAAPAVAPAAAKDYTHITIATEGAYPPYNMTAPDGTLTGFEIDLAHDLCGRMKLQCDIVATDWDGIIPGLNAGKFDAIMAGMSITPKRREVIDFAGPYIASPTTFEVAKAAGGTLPLTGVRVSLDDPAAARIQLEPLRAALKGKIIGVQVSTIQADLLNTYFKDVVADIRTYKTTEEHDLDMQAGRIDAICSTKATIVAAIDKPGGDAGVLAGPYISGGTSGIGSGIGLRKTDPELRDRFDKAIAESQADGATKALMLKWFKADLTPAT